MLSRGNIELPIAMAFDETFASHATVTIASLFANARHSNPIVHVVTPGLSDSSLQKIADVCIRFGRSVQVHEEDGSLFETLPTINAISRTSYMRMKLADVLQDYDKFLYLDADVIVDADLTELYATDMGDHLIAGVADRTGTPRAVERLDLAGDIYLNAGVLLINARAWRAENATERMLAWGRQNSDAIVWMDQDVINSVFRARKLEVDSRWNTLIADVGVSGAKSYWEAPASRKGVFHFNGKTKPWMSWSDPWSQKIYDRYAWLALGESARIEPSTLQQLSLKADSLELNGETAAAAEIRRWMVTHLLNARSEG